MQTQIAIFEFLWNVIGFFIDSKNDDRFICKNRETESIQLYQRIYVYKKMKNDKFNLKRNINKCKNENLLNHVVITST